MMPMSRRLADRTPTAAKCFPTSIRLLDDFLIELIPSSITRFPSMTLSQRNRSTNRFPACGTESGDSCRLNVDESAFLRHNKERIELTLGAGQLAFARHGISFETGLDIDVRHERHCNKIRVALALMLEATTMMPAIFTNRECFRNSTHKQLLDCLRNTGRPEKNSNNKLTVIGHTGRKTNEKSKNSASS